LIAEEIRMVYNKRNVKVWETIFVVEGMGEFPLDMLRYDNAFPLTERDSGGVLI
jgi:hypothetical protein